MFSMTQILEDVVEAIQLASQRAFKDRFVGEDVVFPVPQII